jgi:DNA-binding HxlR family transcriptional regulator/putative sterol carrier protein
MAIRSYEPFCPVARALDLLGERWTLLIVRELLFGQKRYTDLLEGLPGIGPQVLAARLKHLQEAGIARKTRLPPPAASTVYELTELGHQLEDAVGGLARFGLNFVGEGENDAPRRIAGFLAAASPPEGREAARGVKETYEFRVDDEVFHVRVDDGDVQIREGPAADPDFTWTGDFMTFVAIGRRRLDPREAVAAGKAKVEGDPAAARRSLEIFGTPEASASAVG